MVRKVQANQGQDYYTSSGNYYGYEQSQQPQQPADQNEYYSEQAYQPDQSQFQQQYAQPVSGYNYATPAVTTSYSQPKNNNAAAESNNQYSFGTASAQPFIQPAKSHSSPIVSNADYGASYGASATQSAKGSWWSAFGTGGFEGEAPLLEGKAGFFLSSFTRL